MGHLQEPWTVDITQGIVGGYETWFLEFKKSVTEELRTLITGINGDDGKEESSEGNIGAAGN